MTMTAQQIPKRPFGTAARLSSVRQNLPSETDLNRMRSRTIGMGLYGCLVGVRELFGDKLNHEELSDLCSMLNRANDLNVELVARTKGTKRKSPKA